MRSLLVAVMAGLGLAGCADPYQYSYYNPPPLAPPVSRYVPPGYTPPGYNPPGYAPPAYPSAPYPSTGYPPSLDVPGDSRSLPTFDDQATSREAPPTGTGEYETPPVLLRPLPNASDLQPPATGTSTAGAAGEDAASAVVTTPRPPADGNGTVPMMGFRPMKGQRSPGA